ncbi:MAG: ATP-binding cassette domain-containing protein [Candidatus Heimdallarchaeota archaeon]|nr:ATP-binding cassette domain-containing protein [Candidatus Heimdallarchaeota archaeon]
MINCKDLIKIYTDEESNTRIPALRGCDLEVKQGEIITIVGPSGSGKTTLVNILAGMETVSSGTARVGNYILEQIPEVQLNRYRLEMIGIIDQFPERTLFLDATVKDNLKFTSSLITRSTFNYDIEHKEILKSLDILHLENRLIRHLSGGEMIRTAIASALAKNAPVILCDEPTGQLDSENTDNVKRLLRQITRDFGATVLVVTHDPRFQEGVDKTCEIKDGRVSTILNVEDQTIYSGKSKFPLKFMTQIDSSNSIRLPDVIIKTLHLEKNAELVMDNNSKVELKHPKGVTPEKIVLDKITERRKELVIEPLPIGYFDNSSSIIQLNNVSKIYTANGTDVRALSDINLIIKRGELLFILGPSGSGKTTLVKLITGLESITKGEIFLDGTLFSSLTDAQKADFRRGRMGLVSQQGNLHPFLSIEENFYLKQLYSGKRIKAGSLDSKVAEQLERFNITHRGKSYPLEISGGELQRASLAIANNEYPPIVFLDEPTANLDSELAKQAMDEIYNLHKLSGITYLIATHDIDLIRDGERAIQLIDGQINQDGLVITR